MKDAIGAIHQKRQSWMGGPQEVAIVQTRAIGNAATIASQLATRWGMVAAVSDGEDSSGRAKLRIMTPKEIVERAVQVAELLIGEFEARGWFLELPVPVLESTDELPK